MNISISSFFFSSISLQKKDRAQKKEKKTKEFDTIQSNLILFHSACYCLATVRRISIARYCAPAEKKTRREKKRENLT